MPNYQDMYLGMVDATERAISILIKAQRDAEEIYISSNEPDIRIVPGGKESAQPEE